MAKKRKVVDVHINPADITALVTVNAQPSKNKGGHPRTFKTAQELEDMVEEYFTEVKEDQRTYINAKTEMPTIIGKPPYYGSLLYYIGMTYQTITPYAKGEYDNGDNKYSEVLARAKLRCECGLLEGAAQGIYEGRTVQAALSHLHDYAQKVELTGANGGLIKFKGELEDWAK